MRGVRWFTRFGLWPGACFWWVLPELVLCVGLGAVAVGVECFDELYLI